MKKYGLISLLISLLAAALLCACAGPALGKADEGESVAALLKEECSQLAETAAAKVPEDEESEEAEVPLEELSLEVGEKAADDTASGEVWTEEISFDSSWQYADSSMIHTGTAVLYHTGAVSNGITVGVNAGHGTSGGSSVYTYCHPDRSAKVTGGSTAAGAYQATAVSGGMTFYDGTPESSVTLAEARLLRDKLLEAGYDVLMIRDSDDVQLDNVARTVFCNNLADCHIAIHWDGDGLNYDKGCFYISVPDGIKYMEPVSYMWEQDDALGQSLVNGLQSAGNAIYGAGSMNIDLTQTSYSTVPSVDVELGNAASDHSDTTLNQLAEGLLAGVNAYFGL